MGYNPQKQVWFNPNIEYLFDAEITEYDARDAGFNIIKEYHLLPNTKIRELEILGKGLDRHIAIGKLQGQDKEFSKRFQDKFAEVRSIFIDQNSLTDDDIISVKKDAIFTTRKCNSLEFGNIRFAEKNKYSSYLRFSNIGDIEIYYSEDNIDVKNLGESSENKHRLYLLEFIRQTMSMIESKNPRVKRMIMEFIRKYKAQELDREFYIKFDRPSKDVDLLFNYQNIVIPLVMIILKEIHS